WKEQYSFSPKKYALIPCTLNTIFAEQFPSGDTILSLRNSLGFSPSDIILVYSGSSAGWQSFDLVDDFLFKSMSENEKIKLLFLSDEKPTNSKTFDAFENRIIKRWVRPNEVRDLLLCADYGLLIREKSVTNQVASPVKFAEYLACGLQIIISEGIGDFTSFT